MLGAIGVRSICTPFPIANFWHVLAVLPDVARVIDEFVVDQLGEVLGAWTQSRHPVNDGPGQMEPVKLVEHNHVEWCRGCPLFLEPVNVQIVMVGSTIGQLVNQQGLPVIGKDDGFVPGEQRIEVLVAEAVRMLVL